MGFAWNLADGQPGNPAIDPPTAPLAINVLTSHSRSAAPQSDALGFARPSSYHEGGVLMAYCDGRVRFLSDKVSYRVYQAQMTPRGRDAKDTATGRPLPDNHAARQIIDEEALDKTGPG
jgi:hypothetical protein